MQPDASAGRRELDRVAEQVADDVRDLLAIGHHRRQIAAARRRARSSCFFLSSDSFSALTCSSTSRIANVVGDERELVRRAARVRQNLADLIEQLASAADDAANALQLPRRQIAENSVAQNLGVRDHRGERRAQIVRDVREELRLQRVARAKLRDLDRGLLQLRLERSARASGVELSSIMGAAFTRSTRVILGGSFG